MFEGTPLELAEYLNVPNALRKIGFKASKEVISRLKKISKPKIKELGGEKYTQEIKRNTGKSKADLYLDPKTGDVYSIPKQGGQPEWVDKIFPE